MNETVWIVTRKSTWYEDRDRILGIFTTLEGAIEHAEQEDGFYWEAVPHGLDGRPETDQRYAWRNPWDASHTIQ